MATSFNGWGSSWGNSWGAVSVDPNAMSGSASFSVLVSGELTGASVEPQSTRTPKLHRISGGSSWLQHAVSRSRAKSVQARGVISTPTPELVTGATTLLRAAPTASVTRSVRATSSGRASVCSVRAASTAVRTLSSGSSSCRLLRSATGTTAQHAKVTGAASGTLQSATVASTCERLAARGARNLSDTELVAAVVLLTRRNKVVH